MALTAHEARERALQLVKAALDAGVMTPSVHWRDKPEDTGESIGKMIGAAVVALTEKLQEV
ncbi:hypothetical protein [Burkholderia gladioli]|uniref:hypothetical protein n=1 Tax=Burkholderia gladioli TaxID=28095 RepID=UPI00163E871A|nr:hypothetical protein [Burkholderia gladioli]